MFPKSRLAACSYVWSVYTYCFIITSVVHVSELHYVTWIRGPFIKRANFFIWCPWIQNWRSALWPDKCCCIVPIINPTMSKSSVICCNIRVHMCVCVCCLLASPRALKYYTWVHIDHVPSSQRPGEQTGQCVSPEEMCVCVWLGERKSHARVCTGVWGECVL